MKLICHIGTPKTGSTTLQNTCAANVDWLAKRGIVWPDLLAPDANQITLFFAAARTIHPFARDYGLHTEDDVAAFREKLVAKIAEQRKRGARVMLMSSENLTGNLKTLSGVQALHDMLAPLFDDIEIVLYMRRQDDAILSMYAEFMRRGFSAATFDEFTSRALSSGPNQNLPYLDGQVLLEKWGSVFGNSAITVRLFDKTAFADGDVVTDFMQHLLGPDVDLSALTRVGQVNPSLSAASLEFLRRMHPHIPYVKRGKHNPVREKLRDKIDLLPGQPRPQMSEQDSHRIMTHFAASNAWVADTFLGQTDRPLFAPKSGLEPEGNLGKIGLPAFARFSGILLE